MSASGIHLHASNSPLEPSLPQLEQTAAQHGAKQSTALVKDTLQVPLHQLGGDRYKYQSQQNKPMLPGFLHTFVESGRREREPLKGPLKELARKLPKEMREEIAKELKLPKNLRSEDMKSLLKSLEFAAKALKFMKSASKERKISDQQKSRKESVYVRGYVSFFKELLKATKRMSQHLHPRAVIKPFVRMALSRSAKILALIGNQRERLKNQEAYDFFDQRITTQIQSLKNTLAKELGDRTPMILVVLVRHLEELQKLSYPNLHHNFFHLLTRLTPYVDERLPPLFSTCLDALEPFIKPTTLSHERRTLLSICLFVATAFYAQGTDFTSYLILSMCVTSDAWMRFIQNFLRHMAFAKKEQELLTHALCLMLPLLVLARAFDNKLQAEVARDLFPLLTPYLQKPLQKLLDVIDEKSLRAELLTLDRVLEQDSLDALEAYVEKEQQRLGITSRDIHTVFMNVCGLRDELFGALEQLSHDEARFQISRGQA